MISTELEDSHNRNFQESNYNNFASFPSTLNSNKAVQCSYGGFYKSISSDPGTILGTSLPKLQELNENSSEVIKSSVKEYFHRDTVCENQESYDTVIFDIKGSSQILMLTTGINGTLFRSMTNCSTDLYSQDLHSNKLTRFHVLGALTVPDIPLFVASTGGYIRITARDPDFCNPLSDRGSRGTRGSPRYEARNRASLGSTT